MAFTVYEEYNDSNIKWIRKIPKQWQVNKIKDCLQFNIGGTPSTKVNEYFEGDNIWVSIADLNSNNEEYIFDSSVKISDEGVRNSNVKLIKKGSLLYSFKLSVGLTAFAGCDLYTNEAIASFKPSNIVDLNFLKYVLKDGFDNNANINIYGAKIFNSDLIKFSKFVMTKKLEKQQQIANYIDKKTNKINEIIAKNKQLIDLLEEKRTTLINQVVTKGLNPDVTMKDSGVEWIGEIPKHYSIVKLKFLTSKIGSGKTPRGGSEIYVSEGIPLLRSQNIHFDSIKLDDVVYVTDEINQSMLSTVVKNNDVLLNITGASIGRCNYIEDINIANVNQHVCIIRPNKKIFYKYLNYFLQSDCGQNQVFLNQNGTSREGLNFEDLSNFYIILPNDIKEQKTVVLYLEKEIMKIYTTINKVKENIQLLEEYKSSLIHHVVTGKIDVRGEEI